MTTICMARSCPDYYRGGGSTARLGGQELTLLCGFHQYTLLQNRDNSGLLGTLVYYSLKLGPQCSIKLGGGGGGGRPPCPPCGAPPVLDKLLTSFPCTKRSNLRARKSQKFPGGGGGGHAPRPPQRCENNSTQLYIPPPPHFTPVV